MKDLLGVLANTSDIAWAVDGEHHIIAWNQAAERALGYSTPEALGQLCHQLLQGQRRDGHPLCGSQCDVIASASQDRTVESFSMGTRVKAGHTCWLDVSTILVPGRSETSQGPVVMHLARRLGEGSLHPIPLRIHLLGPIMVHRPDGSPVAGPHWRRGKVRSLMALLSTQRGRPIHRDLLLSDLWPDMERSQALLNLNTTIYYLRRCLEPRLSRGADSRYINYQGDCYTLLGGQAHWLDVEAFESGLALAQRESAPGPAIVLYEKSLDLYRGEFLADLGPASSWGWAERERLSQRYLSGLEQLAALHAKQGHHAPATELLQRILGIDPCHEAATQQIMRLSLLRGDRSAAIACYRDLEQALWRELEVLPSTQTVLLLETATRGA